MLKLFPARASLPEYIDKTAEYNGKHLLSALGTPAGRKCTITSITKMLLDIRDPSVIRKILDYLTISDLICIFLGIVSSSDHNDQHSEVLLKSIVSTLNNFPCVKLVDNKVVCKDDPYATSSLFTDNDDFNTEGTLDDDDDKFIFSESIKYQLSVRSIEYVRLLTHLETTHNTPKIAFPLVEIKSRYLNEVSSFVETTAVAVKIGNKSLGILGPSLQLKSRLKIVTLSGYENFNSLKEFNNIEKLIVYGNQVKVEDIREIIKSWCNLKEIYYKGRVAKFSDKMNCTGTETNIKTTYDLICLDRITPEIIDYCGDKNIIGLSEHIFTCNALPLNQGVTSEKPLERSIDLSVLLKSLPNLRKFQMNCLFEEGFISCACDSKVSNHSLHYIDLSRCKFTNSVDFSGLSNLRSASFRNSSIDIKSVSSLNKCKALTEVCFYDCIVYWNAALHLPSCIRRFVLQNIDVDESKNLLFASYSTGAISTESSSAEMERLVGIDINSEKSYLRIGCQNQLSVMKPELAGGLMNGKNNMSSSLKKGPTHRKVTLQKPEVDIMLLKNLTSISFLIYPNFESVDLEKIHSPQWPNIKEVEFGLYAYRNTWHKPLHLPNAGSIKYKFHYVNVNTAGGERSEIKHVLSTESLDEARSSTYSSEDEMKPKKRGRRRGPKPKAKKPVGRPKRRGRKPLREPSEELEALEVPIEDGKYVDRNSDDLSEFQKGYQGRRLPFPVAKHTAPPMATPDDPTKPYQCRFCKRSFDRRENFRRHSLIHTDYRPYVCPMCKKGFKRSDNLRSHMRVCHAANRDIKTKEGTKRGRSKSREKSVPPTITDDSFRIVSQPMQPQQMRKTVEEPRTESPRKKLKLHRDHPSDSPEAEEVKKHGRSSKIRFEPTNLSLAISTPNPMLSKPKANAMRVGGNCVQRLVKGKNSQFILKSIVPEEEGNLAEQQPGELDESAENGPTQDNEKKPHLIAPKANNLLKPNAPSSPPGTSTSILSNSTVASDGSRPDTRSSNTSGADFSQLYSKQPVQSESEMKNEGRPVMRVNLPKLKMFEFVPNLKSSWNSKGDRMKARGGFRPEQIGSDHGYDRELRFDSKPVNDPKPQLLQTYSKRAGDHSKVLVFRMEKPQEAVARHRREEERRERVKANIESFEAPNAAGPSSDQMENRRRLIREKVNEAFNKCERTSDGHYVCFKCGKNFAKRGNVKRHLILHLDVDLYDCICGRTFQRSDNYKSHFMKCKKRRELGLPLSVDADDMQVIPRNKANNLKGEISLSGDNTPGVTSSTLNTILSPDAYSTDSLSASDNVHISSNSPNIDQVEGRN